MACRGPSAEAQHEQEMLADPFWADELEYPDVWQVRLASSNESVTLIPISAVGHMLFGWVVELKQFTVIELSNAIVGRI